MIKIGFVFSYTDSSWVGGINYLSNLLHAISKVDDRKIEPVLIVSPATPERMIALFPAWQVIRTKLVDDQNRWWSLARKLGARALGRDVLMERFLRNHGIAVLSHSGQLGRRATIPTIGWLADFQHRRMPEFFNPGELAARDRGFRRITKQCTTVLLSSFDAQKDLDEFDSSAVSRSRVLHFVSGFAVGLIPTVDEVILREKYALSGPYFHLPNQFWKHKNHRIVIDALVILKARGIKSTVVCTGLAKDRRWPTYFDELMHYAKDHGVAESFRVLGLVPFEDVSSLMRYASAVINPSHFEGWSTTVEEVKSLGLLMILSDIPVHREQDPNYGIFFPPESSTALADAMMHAQFENHSYDKELAQKKAADNLLSRFIGFGIKYQEIAIDTANKSL